MPHWPEYLLALQDNMPSDSVNSLYPDWPNSCLQLLNQVQFQSGKIDRALVKQLCTELDINVGALQQQLVKYAASYSRAPISNFHVG